MHFSLADFYGRVLPHTHTCSDTHTHIHTQACAGTHLEKTPLDLDTTPFAYS